MEKFKIIYQDKVLKGLFYASSMEEMRMALKALDYCMNDTFMIPTSQKKGTLKMQWNMDYLKKMGLDHLNRNDPGELGFL